VDRAAVLGALARRGWAALPPDPALAAWAGAARPIAFGLPEDPALRARDLRCGGSWFAGVNAFPNDADGAAPGGPPLPAPLLGLMRRDLGLGDAPLDRAQVSIVWPGYPRRGPEETEAAFRFRRDRDAAHVDGLLREGPARRRFLAESHLFVLGIPLTEPAEGAAPLVVWEGSHEDMRAAFAAALAGVDPADWPRTDVTDAYVAARRRVFGTRPRVAVTAPVGGAYVVHRLALHGVAPWAAAEGVGPRAVAYFRPDAGPGAAPGWPLAAP
jgi:hypothetical protein